MLLVLLERQYPDSGGCGSSWDLVRGDNIENDLLEFLYGRTTSNKRRGKIILFYCGASEHSFVYLFKHVLYFRWFVSLV